MALLLAALDVFVFGGVIHLADLDALKVANEVLKAHPKSAVIGSNEADFLLQLFRPKLRLVRPVSVPLEAAPRVPQLQDSDLPPIFSYEQLLRGDDAVRVLVGDSRGLLLLRSCLIALSAGAHDEASGVPLDDLLS